MLVNASRHVSINLTHVSKITAVFHARIGDTTRYMRKDIEQLKMIVMAIESSELKANASSLQDAANLDNLYSALKAQAKAVAEVQALEELTEGNN